MRRDPKRKRPISELGPMAKYQQHGTGEATTKDDPTRALWYGPCGFWTDEWDTLKLVFYGLPVCPTCGAPGYVIEASEWFDGLDRYEQEHPEDPGYRASVMARFNVCPSKKERGS